MARQSVPAGQRLNFEVPNALKRSAPESAW